MKTRWLIVLSASATASLVLLAAATSADEPSSKGPTAVAPSDAGADADASPPPLRSFRAEPFPQERSTEPKVKEWDAAPQVAVDRPRPMLIADTEGSSSASCEARRLREWIRIRCHTTMGAISLLGGEREGFVIRLDPFKEDDFFPFPEAGEVVFPVRRGDRRVIEWLRVDIGYKGMRSLEPFIVISEQWPEGDEQPTIVVE